MASTTSFAHEHLHSGKRGHERDANEREEKFGVQMTEQERSLLFLCSIITASLCQLPPLHRLSASSALSVSGAVVCLGAQGRSCYCVFGYINT